MASLPSPTTPEAMKLLANADRSPRPGYANDTPPSARAKRASLLLSCAQFGQPAVPKVPWSMAHASIFAKTAVQASADLTETRSNLATSRYETSFSGRNWSTQDSTNVQLTKTLLGDKVFLAAVSKQLSEDKDFLQAVAEKSNRNNREVDDGNTLVFQNCTTATNSLSLLCKTNGLPKPITKSTFATDLGGGPQIQVEIKVGKEGRSVFVSQQCKTLDEATIQANAKALSALEDLGLAVEGHSPMYTHRSNDIRYGERRHQYQDRQEVAATYQARNKSQSPRNTRLPSPIRTSKKKSSPVSKGSKISFEAVRSKLFRSRNRGIIDASSDNTIPLENVQTPTLPGTSETGKRPRDERNSLVATPPRLNMATLLAQLMTVPATNSKARVLMICEYLEVNEPRIEKVQHPNSTVFIARLALPGPSCLTAGGPTEIFALKSMENTIMQRLREVGFETFTKASGSSKRLKKQHQGDTTRVVVDDDETEEEVQSGDSDLFVIDSTGDEKLARLRNDV